jgi:hypothetical protein
MTPHTPTPEWAITRFNEVVQDDDPERLDAFLHLMASVAPTEQENKLKHEIAWAVIDYGYRKTRDCQEACRRYLGVAV